MKYYKCPTAFNNSIREWIDEEAFIHKK